MEGLSFLIRKNVESGDWKPVRFSCGGLKIYHLWFANDVLLFSSTSTSQVRLVGDTLDLFCKAFSLKVNVHKFRAMCFAVVSRQR